MASVHRQRVGSPAPHASVPASYGEAALTPQEERAYAYYVRRMALGAPRTPPSTKRQRAHQEFVMTRLGAALLQWIQANGMLHHEAADALGIDYKVLWRYIARGTVPRSDVLERIHIVTGLSRDTVLQLAAQATSARRERRAAQRALPHTPEQNTPEQSLETPAPPDPWDAFTARIRTLLDKRPFERRAVLAEIEALRMGAVSPAQRVVRASPPAVPTPPVGASQGAASPV